MWDQTVVREEMWAQHEPRGAQYMGLNWVGPAIMAYGTDDQKARFLPRSRGEVIWCQGFSEPEAGSDLASLIGRADPVDPGVDELALNGQKIWTSYAEMAQWCVLAARVGPRGAQARGHHDVPRPDGPHWITVRPIRSMLGRHHLNEVFLDDVEVGPDEVLGEVGDGWSVIRRGLAHERVGIAGTPVASDCSRWSPRKPVASAPRRRPPVGMAPGTSPGARRPVLAYRAVEEQDRDEPRRHRERGAPGDVLCDQALAELLFQFLEGGSLEAEPSAPLAGR